MLSLVASTRSLSLRSNFSQPSQRITSTSTAHKYTQDLLQQSANSAKGVQHTRSTTSQIASLARTFHTSPVLLFPGTCAAVHHSRSTSSRLQTHTRLGTLMLFTHSRMFVYLTAPSRLSSLSFPAHVHRYEKSFTGAKTQPMVHTETHTKHSLQGLQR